MLFSLCIIFIFLFVFFFFQAEDGIRDADVTGVQTCALPILCFTTSAAFAQTKMWVGGTLSVASSDNGDSESTATFMPQFGMHLNENWSLGGSLGFSNRKRSEERRVGKECRARGVAEQEGKKE